MSLKRGDEGGVLGSSAPLLVERFVRECAPGAGLRVGVGLFYKPAFAVSCVVGYWLTNVLGLLLMRNAAKGMVATDGRPKGYSRNDLLRDLAISLLYTLLIVVLIKCKIIQPIAKFLPAK
jgi:hypothetical protein